MSLFWIKMGVIIIWGWLMFTLPFNSLLCISVLPSIRCSLTSYSSTVISFVQLSPSLLHMRLEVEFAIESIVVIVLSVVTSAWPMLRQKSLSPKTLAFPTKKLLPAKAARSASKANSANLFNRNLCCILRARTPQLKSLPPKQRSNIK